MNLKENPNRQCIVQYNVHRTEPTETTIRAVAAPMFNSRIIKIIDGRSFSSVAPVPATAVFSVLLSMFIGSTVGAGAAAAGAGAGVLNHDGDDILCVMGE